MCFCDPLSCAERRQRLHFLRCSAQDRSWEDGIKTVYDPSHPDADEEGYVDLPNINIVEEMVDMIAASRAYEANATVAENIKTMMQSAMNI